MLELLNKLPRHECGLYLEHNPDRGYYQTVAEWSDHTREDAWISEEEKARAIETNELWVLHWYPDTPIGAYRGAASSLEALLGWASSADASAYADAASPTPGAGSPPSA